jgi:hypothetical protein
MSAAALPEAIAGVLLVFFVPGYAVTKATFPEWRVRGAGGARRLLEIATLSFVLSVVLTVLAGYLLLVAAPAGFQAYWSDPVLEAVLAGVALIGLVVAWFRGGFARTAPAARRPEASGGEEGAWELTRELDRLAREERRIEHALRTKAECDTPRLEQELTELRARSAALRARREAEYAE